MSRGGQSIGLDVGGTKIAAARVAADGSILAQDRVATPAQDMGRTLQAMVELARALMTSDVEAVGIGAAGLVRSSTGVLAFAPNLAWRNVHLVEHVGDALGLPSVADNDATAAAWGEYRFGAGRGCRHLLLVTVGTGIGGGIVTDGRIYRGAHGFAAEIGHIIVEPGGPLCGCGNRGCWEQVASGHAIERAGREAADRYPHSGIAQLAEGVPTQVSGPVVTRAAQDGDETARAILAKVGRRLGEGIAGLVNVLDPEVVVVGGGAVSAGDLMLEPARRAFAGAVEAPEFRPEVPILAAQLGNDAGMVGAAALALESLEGGTAG
ncbi:MAG: ROK family protein [Actinobacteria bacterium]|nr:ROK family protein [Actinomycetota bacterium]